MWLCKKISGFYAPKFESASVFLLGSFLPGWTYLLRISGDTSKKANIFLQVSLIEYYIYVGLKQLNASNNVHFAFKDT